VVVDVVRLERCVVDFSDVKIDRYLNFFRWLRWAWWAKFGLTEAAFA
jgi:hypothetical protein